MADSPNSDWMNQWQALSRQYASAWQDMARAGTGAQASAPTAWPQGWEQAARLLSANAGGQGETADRLIDSAKSYAAFMQSMLAASGANAPGAPSWADALRQGFAMMGGNAGLFAHPAAQAWSDMSGQRGNGFAPMMNAMSAMRSMPAATSPAATSGDLKAAFEMPAFGLLREHQEHYQKGAVAWIDYQEQMRRYNALMLDASQRGLARFEGKLAEREQPGRQIESMRALYDLWVDAAEEGYAEVALSPEFREVYGALVNAQMRVRSQVQHEVERMSTDLGMPTRSEINSIGERLQALRREVRERGADGWVDEVAALRAEVAALRAAKRAPPARAQAKGTRAAKPGKPAGRARSARTVRAIDPAPARATSKRELRKDPQRVKKAVAASAGNFASRIEKFANASLGSPRAKLKPAAKPAKPGRKKSRR